MKKSEHLIDGRALEGVEIFHLVVLVVAPPQFEASLGIADQRLRCLAFSEASECCGVKQIVDPLVVNLQVRHC